MKNENSVPGATEIRHLLIPLVVVALELGSGETSPDDGASPTALGTAGASLRSRPRRRK